MPSYLESLSINVTFINIIRDPIEHLISQVNACTQFHLIFLLQWYYQQSGTDFSNDDRRNLIDVKTINECVEKKMKFCVEGGSYKIIPYFCGNKLKCTQPNIDGVLEAIQNVKQYYLAVGILEDMSGTLELFQRLLPNIFQHSPYLYRIKEAVLYIM